jgi:pimeloyl-ACP methyl ester carboxylesterase
MSLQNPQFIDVAGIRTRYFEKGSGPTVLLLHGSNFGADLSADCSINWNRNFDDLAEWCRVIAIDRLGQGYTDNPKTLAHYTMAAVVEHVAEFIRVKGLKDVHIVGHSRGGYISCRCTLDHPELIKTCVIIDSLTLAPGVGGMAKLMANPPEPRLTKDAQRWVMQRYSYGYDHIDDEWLDELVAVADRPSYREAVSLVRESPFESHLAKQKPETLQLIQNPGLGKPTLVIWGLNDPTALVEQGIELFKMVAKGEPRSQMHIFNRAGHFTYREHPKEFDQLLRGWVAMWA